jgi:hypothetical protein
VNTTANNALNQTIWTGKVAWDHSVASGGYALAGTLVTYGLAGYLDEIGMNINNDWIWRGAKGFGSAVGAQKENGIPKDDDVYQQIQMGY